MTCAVQEGAVSDQICQKWFEKSGAGDFPLDDAPRSQRPVEVDSDHTGTLTENNPCSTTQETANILKLSRSIKCLLFYGKNYTDFLANPVP